MAILPQEPKSSHWGKISVVTSRSVNIGEEDGRPAGRRKNDMTKFGRRSTAGLEPKPSDDMEDPLNWPRWKKETAYGSLLLMTSTICILKTLYVTTNSVIASQYNTSYLGAAAFTGLPFIIAAIASIGSAVLSQVIGKRIIFLVSGLLMLVGVLWNKHVFSAYGWFMISRIMQAVGWGATEVLVTASIRDIFFVHERGLRTTILNIVSLTFTWGSPILGGSLSQSSEGFRNQLMVVNVIQAFAVLFMIVFVPETSFDRSKSPSADASPISAFAPTAITTISGTSTSIASIKTYLNSLHPLKYTARFSLNSVLKPIRALSAPSSLLTFLLTGPMIASAYGVANSLSQLFAAMPTFLFPERLGYIFTLPLVLSIIVYALTSFISYLRYKPPHHLSHSSATDHLTAAMPGLLLGIAGLLSFGLYIEGELTPETIDQVTVFSLDVTGINLSLKIVSLLFGMLVAGSTLVNFAASAHLASSSVSTSSGNSNHGEALLQPSHAVLENVLIGMFIMGFPSWVQGSEGNMEGLKNTVIVIAVLQIVIATTVGALLFVKGEGIRAVDRRVLGIREDEEDGNKLQWWKSEKSFMEI